MQIQKHTVPSIFIILALLIQGCYKDEGNYDYTELNEISVSTPAIGSYFAVNRYENIRIEPELNFSIHKIPDNELSFKWEMYIDNWANAEAKATLLSTDKILNTVISRPESTDLYALVLTVTNNQNNTSYRFPYQLSVQPSVLSGIMVLQEDAQDGHCRLDYLASTNAEPTFSQNRHLKDVYSTANNGEVLNGSPRGISFSLVTKSSYEPQVKHLYVWTDQETVKLDASDFTLQYANTELFQIAPDVVNTENIQRSSAYDNSTIMINNGDVHSLNQQTSLSWGYQFSRKLKGNNSLPNPMKFSKYIYQADMFPSQTGYSAVLFDTIGKRFVKIGSENDVEPALFAFNEQSDAAKKHFDVNNIGKDLIWLGKGNGGQGFAIVGNKTDREILRMRLNVANTIEDEEGNSQINEQVYNTAIGKYDLSKEEEGNDARFFDCGCYANTLIYASKRNLYTYDFSARKATRINDSFPEGEEITAMKIYNVEFYTENIKNVSGNLLYVATWNGTEGKIYEFALNRTTCRLDNRNSESGNTKEPLHVFTGFGKVIDLCVKPQGRGD